MEKWRFHYAGDWLGFMGEWSISCSSDSGKTKVNKIFLQYWPQVIMQAEKARAELEVKQTKHEILKVCSQFSTVMHTAKLEKVTKL